MAGKHCQILISVKKKTYLTLRIEIRSVFYFNNKLHSLPDFVGCAVGFLNVLIIRLRSLLLAA